MAIAQDRLAELEAVQTHNSEHAEAEDDTIRQAWEVRHIAPTDQVDLYAAGGNTLGNIWGETGDGRTIPRATPTWTNTRHLKVVRDRKKTEQA